MKFLYSAFWGQSFVGELTRISAQAERKRISIDGNMDIDEGVDVKDEIGTGRHLEGAEKAREKLAEVGQSQEQKHQQQQEADGIVTA